MQDNELLQPVFAVCDSQSLLQNTTKAADVPLKDSTPQADGKAKIALFPYLRALGKEKAELDLIPDL